jgi:hypothetical protein
MQLQIPKAIASVTFNPLIIETNFWEIRNWGSDLFLKWKFSPFLFEKEYFFKILFY